MIRGTKEFISHNTYHVPRTTFMITPKIIPHTPLSTVTTFQLGGSCQGLINCQTPKELQSAVKFLNDQKEKFILIGGGSNLVVSDQGLDCFVIRYVSERPLVERSGNDVVVSASTVLDHLVQLAISEGLEGINTCSGIPGTVGGAVVGNAGAWGKQVGDVLKYVIVLKPDGSTQKVQHKDLGFTYRHSRLKESGDILLSVCFTLQPAEPTVLENERREILAKRQKKHPDLTTRPCAGSFFRNIEPTSKADKRQAAGWFLEQAGGKDLKVGGAEIFEKHANIIVKGKDCTAQDVCDLSREMAKRVKDKFNFDLVREVRFVGKFAGKQECGDGMIW